ncbi:P-loop containing nucleoside triphosphate hydrolase protein [Thelephora ganbajun]|uniref:P-loop containing nucleoside triphosphate hydrolase protein n=1 Tax=Thelephora ganbajun TaxID=370292 RepID=A0ACB6ZGJ1_THEGA|nr:P-loop containing nucleoside triphosphate hydrolase protein [Thelephora ganbajun]
MVGVCRALLDTGSCSDDHCRFHHDVHICEACSVVCLTGNAFQAHLGGKNHRKTLQRAAYAQAHGIDTEFCELCQIPIPDNNWEWHQRTRRHVNKQRFLAFKSLLEEVEKDKHGISVSAAEGVDYGIIELEEAQAGRSVTLAITTSVPLSSVRLVEVKLTSTSNRGRTSPFFVEFIANKIVYGRATHLTINFTQTYRGRYEDRAEILFEDTKLGKEFMIVRPLRVIVGSREDHAALRPTAPYIPRRRTKRAPVNEVVPGVPPESNAAITWRVLLPQAEIPAHIILALKYGSTKVQIESIKRSALPRTFEAATYGRHFKTLLWAEEFQMENDLERYDISDATLMHHGRYHFLEVPGLAEKRPSVLKGDTVLVQPQGETRWFEGYVHLIRQREVGLCFARSFRMTSPQQKFSVRFKLNRIPVRRQHQAMDTVFEQTRALFPTRGHFSAIACPSILGVRRAIYNPDIASNGAQLQAIASILALPAGSPPFCVFGPPGTGKTVTIVEGIRQLLRQNPLVRILACAPSNSAADLIAERLAGVLSPGELFRFYASSRSKESTPSKLEDYTYQVGEMGTYAVPPMSRMTRFKVIVSTCVSASVFHGIGMQCGHFGYIFVDEAGQATEPEVMIAVKTMADNATRVILSGDHKQLGPIIRSNVARALGLETSYLERLMGRDGYEEVQNYGISVVKLVKNFRSHETILRFPNQNFYRGDLQASAPRQVIDYFINRTILPNPRFPILFHGIVGKDDREASSPSFFNIEEVTEIKDYVMRLKRNYRITDHEIGIITPYHAQVLKIRATLKAVADEVKVGSVEEFQGQERKVIIISTVRSSSEHINYDVRHTLGFVANPRRFNVAVTRAMALLIVIGNPEVLSLDPMWRSFLNYIRRNNGCIGVEISWDYNEEVDVAGDYAERYRNAGMDDMNALTIRLQERIVARASVGDAESDDEGGNVDRPWRDIE